METEKKSLLTPVKALQECLFFMGGGEHVFVLKSLQNSLKEERIFTMKLRKNKKKGFSLVELVVVIAIMAIMTAVLAPSLLSYVERSRAQKDDSAMSEVVNSIMLALADQNVYDEVLCYTASDNKSCYVDGLATYDAGHASYTPTKKSGETVLQYMFDDNARLEDEEPYAPAGVMRGVTITFEPEKSTNKSCFVLYNGIINKFGPTNFIYGEMPETEANGDEELLLGGMASFGSMTNHYLYNRIRSTVGDKIELTSQTYRNSEYTVFIRMGTTGGNQADKQDAIAVYGQWNGTNLSYNNSGTQQGGSTPQPPVSVEVKDNISQYSWAELKLIAQSDKPLSYYNIAIGDTISDENYTYVLVDDARDSYYNGLVFMFNTGTTYMMNSTATNEGGFAASDMCDYLNNTQRNDSIIRTLSDDLLNAIKAVDVRCSNGNSNSQQTQTASGVQLFLPSVREVGFKTLADAGWDGYDQYDESMNKECVPEGETYDYNKAVFDWFNSELGQDANGNRASIGAARTRRVLPLNGWWLRSTYFLADDGFLVVCNGSSTFGHTANTEGQVVVPTFVIG